MSLRLIRRGLCTEKSLRPFSADPYSWRITKQQSKDIQKNESKSLFHLNMRPMQYMDMLRGGASFNPLDLLHLKRKSDIACAKVQQMYIPERNRILGNDLAAAHFIVYRDGRIRFEGQTNWIAKDKNANYDLPELFDGAYRLQDIDCSNMDIYFEGLLNLTGLKHLKTISFRNCKTIDDWSMNRISSIFVHHLQAIDLRGCTNVTYRGLGTLFKCRDLRYLSITNREESDEIQLVCLILEELNPYLEIHSEIHQQKSTSDASSVMSEISNESDKQEYAVKV